MCVFHHLLLPSAANNNLDAHQVPHVQILKAQAGDSERVEEAHAPGLRGARGVADKGRCSCNMQYVILKSQL